MKNNNLGSMTKRKAPKGTLRRLIKMLFGFYPVLVPLTILCILFAAAAAASHPACPAPITITSYLNSIRSVYFKTVQSYEKSCMPGRVIS